MSFDSVATATTASIEVSIPFDQGNVFRLRRFIMSIKTLLSQSLSIRAMSFDLYYGDLLCLSNVSIPFDQGNVFRLQQYAGGRNYAVFQTHFPIFLEG